MREFARAATSSTISTLATRANPAIHTNLHTGTKLGEKIDKISKQYSTNTNMK
jgi:hypothetical protein